MKSKFTAFMGITLFIDPLSIDSLEDVFLKSGSVIVSCLNPYSCWLSLSDPKFQRSLAASNCICDGRWLAWALRFRRGEISCITGSDFFESVCLNAKSLESQKMFFIGGTERSLAELKKNVTEKFVDIKVVGSCSPPFQDEFDDGLFRELGDQIRAVEADVVWIGLGAPKQEKFATTLLSYCSPSLIGCVGAVFDFQSGDIKRAPQLFRKFGLEWLHRLVGSPRRIWPRVLPSLLVVIGVAFGILK